MVKTGNTWRFATEMPLFSRILFAVLCSGILSVPAVYADAVSVIDSGVNPNHADLAGRILPGVDLVDGDNNPFDDTPEQHGTTISRIVASVSGSNRILPVRVLGAGGQSSVATVASGISYAANSSPKVINLSLGSTINVYNVAIADSIQGAAGAGKLIVIAAGNGSFSQPTFPASLAAVHGGSVIAVGALDPNGQIASYSNRAGPSKQYFITAPGYSGFSSYIGTSFAAPYVSGAAAAILSQNPGLSARQVSEIILSSADDLGAPGIDDVYGRGGLNIAAALAPQGEISVAGDDDSSGGSGALVAGLLVGGAIAAAVIYKNKSLKQTVVLDSYDRPYQVDLDEMIAVRDDGLSLDVMLQNLRRTTETSQLVLTDDLQMAVWYDRRPELERYDLGSLEGDSEMVDAWSASLQYGGTEGGYYALNLNLDPRQFFGLAEQVNSTSMFDRRNITAPYAGFAASGNMLLAGFRAANGADLKMGLVSMNEDDDYGVSSKSLLLEGSVEAVDKLRLGLQLSGLEEQGSLFGGSARGALSVDNTDTLAIGLTARWKLNNKLSLHSIYSQGYSWVRERQHGILQNFSTIGSSSYAIGLSGNHLVREGDTLSLTWSSPLHVDDGSLVLDVPTGYDVVEGRAYREQEMLELGSSEREMNLELGYHLPLGKQSAMAAYMLYRDIPAEITERVVRGRYGVMMSVSSRF